MWAAVHAPSQGLGEAYDPKIAFRMTARKDQIGGFVKYSSPDGKRLTGVPGAQSPTNGKPWQLHPAGVGGDQFFGQKFNGGCG
jgi:hypothetical protein